MTRTEYSLSGTEARVTFAGRYHRSGRLGVLFGTERGATPANMLTEPNSTLARKLAQNYGVAMTSSAPTGLSYGNDAAIAAFSSMRTQQLHTELGCRTDKVAVVGRSMGGCQALNWARQNKALITSISLVCPLVNLVDGHDRVFEAEIDAAYGSHANYLAALSTHNPMAYAAELAGVPIRIWYASNDTSILPADVLAFASSVGSSCSVVNMGAVGHTVTAAPVDDVASWISEHVN